MPSIVTFPAGRSFQFTVFCRMTLDYETVWSSTYWALSIASGGIGDLQSLAQGLALFTQAMMTSSAQVWKVEVRSGAIDSNPYDPTTFATWVYNMPGTRVGQQGDMLAVDVALAVTRHLFTGKNGTIYLRGVLTEGDVWASAGRWVFANAVSIAALLSDAVSAGMLSNWFQGGSNPVLRLTVVSFARGIFRNYLGLQVRGVSINKRNHRYFDRGAAPTTPTEWVEPSWETIQENDPDAWASVNPGEMWVPPNVDITNDQPAP